MTAEGEEKSLRYRRAQSVTRAEEITEKEKKARKLQLDKPCHVPRDSLFSWSSQFTDFTGLVNWGFLMLSIGGLRLCLENFLKYGIRVNPIEWIVRLTGSSAGAHQHPSLVLFVFSPVPAVFSLLVEKGIAMGSIPEKAGRALHVGTLLTLITLPLAVLHFRGHQFSFVGAELACMIYLVIFLKLWSYCQVNRWCRDGLRARQGVGLRRQSLSAPNHKPAEDSADQPARVRYPDNLTLRDLAYFLLAPTLCYELNFPRTTRIRKRFVLKRLVELIVGLNLMICLFQQWMTPTITNSMETMSHIDLFSQMDMVRLIERLLKLSVPNHLLWLCFFYLSFHSFLNFVGELMHFADRNFYNDWWNANNISVFWSSWNMPVHRWAVRHVYIPITQVGYSKTAASVVVFLISAFFHEYLVSVPLQMFRIWAFLGMMAQPPLAVISKIIQKRFGDRWGNIIVWSSLILGQPLAVMMYYHDYALLHYAPK